MIGGECCKVGNKEEIVEQLNRARLAVMFEDWSVTSRTHLIFMLVETLQ